MSQAKTLAEIKRIVKDRIVRSRNNPNWTKLNDVWKVIHKDNDSAFTEADENNLITVTFKDKYKEVHTGVIVSFEYNFKRKTTTFCVLVPSDFQSDGTCLYGLLSIKNVTSSKPIVPPKYF